MACVERERERERSYPRSKIQDTFLTRKSRPSNHYMQVNHYYIRRITLRRIPFQYRQYLPDFQHMSNCRYFISCFPHPLFLVFSCAQHSLKYG